MERWRRNRVTSHYDYECDLCEQYPIVGVRYRCKGCPNFDLCERCHKTGQHPDDHVMREITKPITKKEREKEIEDAKILRALLKLFPDSSITGIIRAMDDLNLPLEPVEKPSLEPVEKPSLEPVEKPSLEPVEKPSLEPVEKPSLEPVEQPFQESTEKPSVELREQPSVEHTEKPLGSKSQSTLQERMTCPVCMDAEKTVAFFCGHSFCASCSRSLHSKCAICRKPTLGRVYLHITDF